MINFLKSYYPDFKLFWIMMGITVIFVGGFFFKTLFVAGWVGLSIVLFLALAEIFLLYRNRGINAERILPERFSNGDENEIVINLKNHYNFDVKCSLIDEIPVKFQNRDFLISNSISANSEVSLKYSIQPTERGNYVFGKLNVYVSTFLGFGKRRYIFCDKAEVPVYPSFLKLKYYEMIAISNRLSNPGITEVRKLGHTMEFEHIRDYRTGDDYRTINWKASARKNDLMVNQYIDERSQSIYSIIDMGRNMKMPFNGMSLLDYSINTALALSTIIHKRYDKAGLLTYSDRLKNFLPASSQAAQIQKIMETLYKLETDFAESDFELLYSVIRRKISQRSLLLIFTNFESQNAMRRNLNYLKLITKFHLPVVIFFENTEVTKMLSEEPSKMFEIYKKVETEQYLMEKYEIMNELKINGIMSMMTTPENLTLKSINKYLEIKSRRIV